MSDQEVTKPGDTHQVFLDMLEESGFFQQINNLEESLKAITAELQSFGENAKERMEETENLSAHVLACESILAVMLKKYPIDAGDLKAEIKDRSPTVQALALNLVEKAGK